MATQTIVQITDDLTGDVLADGDHETVEFALDGKPYEIDLSTANAAELRDLLAKYVAHARRATAEPARTPGRKASAPVRTKKENDQIREWAKGRGLKVSERGRIPVDIIRQYELRDLEREAAQAEAPAPEPAAEEKAPSVESNEESSHRAPAVVSDPFTQPTEGKVTPIRRRSAKKASASTGTE